MVEFTKDHGIKIQCMVKGNILGQMEDVILVIILMIKKKVMESFLGLLN